VNPTTNLFFHDMLTIPFFVSDLFIPDPDTSLPAIIQLCLIGAVEYTSVVFSALIDLWSGMRKAKRMGIKRTSHGLRRTVSKLSSYLVLMAMLTGIDIAIVLSCLFLSHNGMSVPPPFLWLTSLGAAGHILIEAISVLENLEQGPRLRSLGKKLWYFYRKNRRSATF